MPIILEPAIRYARDGYPITHILSSRIHEAAADLSQFSTSKNLFLPVEGSPRRATC